MLKRSQTGPGRRVERPAEVFCAPELPRPEATCVVYGPRTKRIRVVLEDPTTIGRHPKCTITLDDEQVSRRHCTLERHGAGWVIRDHDSSNGTRVNEERIADRERIRHGDVVRVGATLFRFLEAAPTSDIAPAPAESPAGVPDLAAVIRARDELSDDAGTLAVEARCIEDLHDPFGTLTALSAAQEDQRPDLDALTITNCHDNVVHTGGTNDGPNATAEQSSRALLRLLLSTAIRARATDIHIEPRRDDASIRLRVDGAMVTATPLSRDACQRLIAMVAVLCEFPHAPRGTVHDGHFAARLPSQRIDFRVSMTPTMHGPKLVIRLLDSGVAPSRLHELGLSGWMFDRIQHAGTRETGLLLACGPTGSGKTTTLYSCLREIDRDVRNVVTIEDPVEQVVEGCTQIPVGADHGLGFHEVLRSVLRQDADVILVGEVRDHETASVALQAAITGHLVSSTIHARDTTGAIFRLLDLKVEPYLVANAISIIVAQRLTRVLCRACRRRVTPTSAQRMTIGETATPLERIAVPTGCRRCLRTGYHGRRAIFEVLEMNDAQRDVVLGQPTISRIRQACDRGHFQTLREFGMQLVRDEVTSLDEVERVTG